MKIHADYRDKEIETKYRPDKNKHYEKDRDELIIIFDWSSAFGPPVNQLIHVIWPPFQGWKHK